MADSESYKTLGDSQEILRLRERIAALESAEVREQVAAEKLRQNEAKYRELVENVSSIVLRLDTSGNITFANRYACCFFGFPKNKLLGKNVVGTIVPPVEQSGRDLAEHIHDLCEHPERYENNENENTRRNGSRVWVSWTNRALRDAENKPTEILCIGNDITARKEAGDKLQKEQKMLRRLLEAQHHEKQLIAYEIHDGLAQLLTSTVLQLQMFEHLRNTKPDEAEKTYQSARLILDQAIVEVRRLIQGLRPAVLEEAGVVTAIRLLIAEQEERFGADIEFICDVQFDRLDPLLENALYRIAQECLNNASRYSGAKNVRVGLQQKGDQITLEIRDWGRGFDTVAVGADSFGLEGIRQRAKIFDGEASIESTVGEGTRISVQFPVVTAENSTAEN